MPVMPDRNHSRARRDRFSSSVYGVGDSVGNGALRSSTRECGEYPSEAVPVADSWGCSDGVGDVGPLGEGRWRRTDVAMRSALPVFVLFSPSSRAGSHGGSDVLARAVAESSAGIGGILGSHPRSMMGRPERFAVRRTR
jgi:hypothetical protein